MTGRTAHAARTAHAGRSARAASAALALLALTAGCASSPSPRPSPSLSPSPAASTSAGDDHGAPAAGAPWRPSAALSGERLAAVLLPDDDLPPGSTAEGLAVAPTATALDPKAEAASQQHPECAPVLRAMFERPAGSVRRWYVTGSNVLANRTQIDVAGIADGLSRERFEALRAAVTGGGCTGLRVDNGKGGVQLTVEPVPWPGLDVPAVGFRVRTPTGAVASAGGFTRVYLWAAVGDNRVLFLAADDTAHAPALRPELVTPQLQRLLAAAGGPADQVAAAN
ncbi:hypothetical protein [Kitasatospora purpeofusca]|uniref:hypothetical protein n=1 Tax=Kitasatospora purpeofusca TaxID=67352 RepID=UPI002A5991A6|nr:hypothetical protein [Kitasatospora purpeofusca]MDY0814378.1 hypothetical protein [Kitasatospora purpeofusca]